MKFNNKKKADQLVIPFSMVSAYKICPDTVCVFC